MNAAGLDGLMVFNPQGKAAGFSRLPERRPPGKVNGPCFPAYAIGLTQAVHEPFNPNRANWTGRYRAGPTLVMLRRNAVRGPHRVAQCRGSTAVRQRNGRCAPSVPDGNGIDLIRVTARRCPATDTTVITVFGDEPHVFASIEAGATGYIVKDSMRRTSLR